MKTNQIVKAVSALLIAFSVSACSHATSPTTSESVDTNTLFYWSGTPSTLSDQSRGPVYGKLDSFPSVNIGVVATNRLNVYRMVLKGSFGEFVYDPVDSSHYFNPETLENGVMARWPGSDSLFGLTGHFALQNGTLDADYDTVVGTATQSFALKRTWTWVATKQAFSSINSRIGNKNTKVFHTLNCRYAQDLSNPIIFSSHDAAVAAGYSADQSHACTP